jgi:predicted RNA binding protein YcfA (HicA-like mRNA interferase family)
VAFSPNVWNQLKNVTADDLVRALERDGWTPDPSSKGAIQGFIKKHGIVNERVTIHYHPKKTYGPKLLKGLIKDIGWNDEDLTRLRLIK